MEKGIPSHPPATHQMAARDESVLKIGSVVLIRDDNALTMHGPLRKIIDLHPGKDNIIRAVSVKTKNGIYKRAAARVCVVPLDD